MKDGSNAIDVSSLSELVRIRREEDILRERLQKMESARERVSEIVFRRVRDDYEKRKIALETEARGPRQQAALEYRRLRELTLEAERSLQESKFELEETELRHELGEFPEDTYEGRSTDGQRRVSERQKILDEFGAMKSDFVKAFPSEEELERAATSAAEGTKAANPAQDGPTTTTAQMDVHASIPGAPLPPAMNPDATIVGVAPLAGRAHTKNPGPPPAVRAPRLILFTNDEPEREYALRRAPMSIGRSSENEIYVPFPDVSRAHASIVPEGDAQFKVIDRGSPNGVIVNGALVKEHVLSEGDVIQIGRRKLVFRA
jgi:hypothetical protein